MKIGVLALQGSFIEHIRMLRGLGVETAEVRLPEALDNLDGLIIPGGESTTIIRLSDLYGLKEPIRRMSMNRPIWGTCAGMIVLAREVEAGPAYLGLMDISVRRNAFGRQIESFEAPLAVPVFAGWGDTPFPGIFIRAPRLLKAAAPAEIIASLPDGSPVAARQGKLLATAFHPELTEDDRFHRYFLSLA
jgi:pyridoxal 5'-phosphate synthase pdxT subunit